MPSFRAKKPRIRADRDATGGPASLLIAAVFFREDMSRPAPIISQSRHARWPRRGSYSVNAEPIVTPVLGLSKHTAASRHSIPLHTIRCSATRKYPQG